MSTQSKNTLTDGEILKTFEMLGLGEERTREYFVCLAGTQLQASDANIKLIQTNNTSSATNVNKEAADA